VEAIRGVLERLCIYEFLASGRSLSASGNIRNRPRTPITPIIYIGKEKALLNMRTGLLRSRSKRDRFVLKVDLTIADETFC